MYGKKGIKQGTQATVTGVQEGQEWELRPKIHKTSFLQHWHTEERMAMSRYKMRVAEKTEVMADLTYVQVLQMPQQQRMGNQINTLEEHVQLVNYVKSFNSINAIGAKVQLCTKWNLGLMQQLANSDSDREVITFLRYGWPLNHDGRATMITKFNHPTALRFPQQSTGLH